MVPPLSSFLSADLRVFGLPGWGTCLHLPHRLSGSWTPPRVAYPACRPNRVSRRLLEPTIQAPRVSSSALQHFRMKKPFFSLLAKRSEDRCPALGKSPPQGLATLSGTSVFSPWGASLSSQHSWASLFRALLLSRDRITLSDHPLRSRASLQNLLSFGSAPQRLPLTGKAVPLFAPRRISPGRDRLLS